MSIEFWALEDTSAEEHALHVQNLLNQGWQRVFSAVYSGESGDYFDESMPAEDTPLMSTDVRWDTPIFLSYLQRGTIDGTVNKASVMEAMERRIRRLERLVKQMDVLMQGYADDEAVPTAWLENQMEMFKTVRMAGNPQFIPLGDIYAEVLAEADAEDALREGQKS